MRYSELRQGIPALSGPKQIPHCKSYLQYPMYICGSLAPSQPCGPLVLETGGHLCGMRLIEYHLRTNHVAGNDGSTISQQPRPERPAIRLALATC